jgi:Zn-dependent protease
MVAITTHEAGHGAMAYAFGDDTAQKSGRLTFNPLAHIDPLGTLILPGLMLLTHAPFLFGWAKPVPVNFAVLKPQRLGLICVAFAGPLVNLIFAFTAILFLTNVPNDVLETVIRVNLILAAFNLIPLLPLDGGRIVTGLLPPSLAYEYNKSERYGMFILMILIISPSIFGLFGFRISPLMWIIKPIYEGLSKILFACAGY